MFFKEQTPDSLAGVIKIFRAGNFDSNQIQKKAAEFSSENFRSNFSKYLSSLKLN
jgi:hypothetical protein